jgi:hypothetical protein
MADASREASAREATARPAGHETVCLPVIGVGASLVAQGGAPPLTVEQYAAFCAELTVLPGRAADLHKKYGIADPAARRALDDGFAERFHVDPELRRRWGALVAHYESWYRAQGAH